MSRLIWSARDGGGAAALSNTACALGAGGGEAAFSNASATRGAGGSGFGAIACSGAGAGARRKALFLALSLSRRPANEIAGYLGIEGKWQPYVLMSKAAEEVRQDPKGAETILELAAQVHRDAPAMLLGDIPAYDLEAA